MLLSSSFIVQLSLLSLLYVILSLKMLLLVFVLRCACVKGVRKEHYSAPYMNRTNVFVLDDMKNNFSN